MAVPLLAEVCTGSRTLPWELRSAGPPPGAGGGGLGSAGSGFRCRVSLGGLWPAGLPGFGGCVAPGVWCLLEWGTPASLLHVPFSGARASHCPWRSGFLVTWGVALEVISVAEQSPSTGAGVSSSRSCVCSKFRGSIQIDTKVPAQTCRKARRMVHRNWSPEPQAELIRMVDRNWSPEPQGLTVSLARRGAYVRSGAPWQPHSSCPTTPDMPLGALCPDAEEESGPNGMPLGALCPEELIEW